MNINKYLKKRIGLFVLSLVFVIVLTLGSSYALLNNNINMAIKSDVNGLKVNYAKSDRKDGSANYIASVITVENTLAYAKSYALEVHAKNNHVIDLHKVYYRINESEPKNLGDCQDGEIYTNHLPAQKAEEIDLEIWIASELVDAEDEGKSLALEYKIVQKK